MVLNDFIAKLPISVIAKTEITSKRVILPGVIKIDEFYANFADKIEANTLTTEKCIYLAAVHEQADYQTAISLLNSKIKYS